MQYHVKRPGSFLWDTLTTDSLASELECGRLRGHWKIRRDGEAEEYTVDELCREDPRRRQPGSDVETHFSGDTASASEDRPPARRGVFYFLSVLLIATFLWRMFTAAHEYDSPEMVYFSIGLDVLCVVALIGARLQIAKAMPAEEKPWIAGNTLFLFALIAGLGLLAIRTQSTEAWWTGHARYELLPRR